VPLESFKRLRRTTLMLMMDGSCELWAWFQWTTFWSPVIMNFEFWKSVGRWEMGAVLCWTTFWSLVIRLLCNSILTAHSLSLFYSRISAPNTLKNLNLVWNVYFVVKSPLQNERYMYIRKWFRKYANFTTNSAPGARTKPQIARRCNMALFDAKKWPKSAIFRW